MAFVFDLFFPELSVLSFALMHETH